MNLIGHDDDAVAGRDLLQGRELLTAPDPAHRVVRVAQEQQARTGRLDDVGDGVAHHVELRGHDVEEVVRHVVFGEVAIELGAVELAVADVVGVEDRS